MKIIQRFINTQAATIPGAGVYSGSLAISATALFNLTINRLAVSYISKDNVTNQSIEGVVQAVNAINATATIFRNNPGLLSTSQGMFILTAAMGRVAEKMIHIELAAGESIQSTITFNLNVVTANPIRCDAFLTIGYLCPEDYLSIEAFAVKPE